MAQSSNTGLYIFLGFMFLIFFFLIIGGLIWWFRRPVEDGFATITRNYCISGEGQNQRIALMTSTSTCSGQIFSAFLSQVQGSIPICVSVANNVMTISQASTCSNQTLLFWVYGTRISGTVPLYIYSGVTSNNVTYNYVSLTELLDTNVTLVQTVYVFRP